MDAMIDARHASILEAANAVFFRFGFRKTSMDEIARAAGISRQGLYLRFANKEDVFRAVVTRNLDAALRAALAALEVNRPLERRIVGAMDAWTGAYVETIRNDVADLTAASFKVAEDKTKGAEAAFLNRLAECIDEAGLLAACPGVAKSPQQLAEIILASVQGIRHSCNTRQEFLVRITVAIRIFCLPLGAGPSCPPAVASAME